MTLKNMVHLELGSENKFAFVFSCPGQKEQDATPPGPAKGQTGGNLNKLLSLLSSEKRFTGMNREMVTITNSWDKVEYKGKTKRTEATKREVLDSNNLHRLAMEIENIEEIIFASGENAKACVSSLNLEGKLKSTVQVISLRHLGNQSINQIRWDKDGIEIITYNKDNPKPISEKRSLKELRRINVQRRFEKVAFDLLNDIESENFL